MTPTEERIAAIYGEAIGLEGVTAEDDPYMLGADSELAVRIVLEIEREFGIELPEDVIETGGVVSDMAALVDRLVAEQG